MTEHIDKLTEHIDKLTDKLRRFDYDDYGFPVSADTRSKRQARKRHKKQTVHQYNHERAKSLNPYFPLWGQQYLLILKAREEAAQHITSEILILKEAREEATRCATEPAKDAMSKSAQKNALRKAKRAAKERECSVE